MFLIRALFIMVFFLGGCIKPDANTPVTIDPELRPYLTKFEEEIGVDASGINIVFGDIEGDIVGFCNVGWKRRSIVIDRSSWKNLEHYEKEELMYHELGHCAMDLDHDDEQKKILNSCPSSVMNSRLLGICYKLYTNYYKQELKSKKR